MGTLIKDARNYISQFTAQEFYFWAIAAYLVFEYVRPQQIYPVINVLPWAQTALILTIVGFMLARKPLRFHFTDFLMVTFLAVLAWSAVSSEYPEYSIARLDVFYSWVIVVWCFHNAVNTRKKLFLITVFFLLACFKMSLFGAKVWAGRGFSFTDWGIQGPPGFFNNSGELSLLMVMVVALSICFLRGFSASMSRMQKLVYYLLPITAAMTVLASSSRGGQLSMIVVMVMYFLVVHKASIKRIAALGLVIGLVFIGLPEEQKARFDAIGTDRTSEARLAYWGAAWDMMNEHKLLGVGHYAFPQYFRDYYRPRMEKDNPLFDRMEVAHNTYLDLGATTGYLGLSVYLLLVYQCFRLTRKTRRLLAERGDEGWIFEFSRGLDLSMVGYLVGSLFMSVAFYPFIYLQLMLSQAMFSTVAQEKPSPKPAPETVKKGGFAWQSGGAAQSGTV